MSQEHREFPDLNRKERMKLATAGWPTRSAKQRIQDFGGVHMPLDADWAVHEAKRCIHCPDPAPCTLACPVGNDISMAMWLIEHENFLQAAQVYRQTSSMPEICSLVCPHDQLCQGSCPRGKRGDPVMTGALEAFITQYERETTGVTLSAGKPSGHKVAVVGAGPAGLSCAEQLIRQGHHVTIFESKPAPGGLLTYGIPNFKLPKEHVFNLWNDLQAVGIEFVPNTHVGTDITINELLSDGFAAVFLGVGANVDAPMRVDGENLTGVVNATEFLIRSNVSAELLPVGMTPYTDIGQKVAVIGGGDTAADCLRSAIRLGAEEVTCLYRRTEAEMPGNAYDRELAIEEGANYQFLTQPVKFIPGKTGELTSVECVEMELGEPDKSGRPRPIPIEGSNFTIEVDTIVKALGYWPDETIGKATPDLETHNWGLVVADAETGATSRAGVFAGGDGVTGPDLVVTAMAAGRKSAIAIHTYMNQK